MKGFVVHVLDGVDFGGAEQASLTILAGLKRSGWEPLLIHPRHPGTAELRARADALRLPTLAVPEMTPGWPGARRLPAFVRLLRRLNPLVVHLHLNWPLACQYAAVAAGVAGVPALVATCHLYVKPRLSRRVMVQQRLIFRSVDRCMAVSYDIAEKLVHEMGWAPPKMAVVYNGVDATLEPRPADEALRAAIMGRDHLYLVVVPARLAPQKGQRTVLHAAADLPRVHLAFAGEGPDRPELEALAARLGLAQRVSFLGQRRDMPDLLASADAIVLPSLFEGLPLAILEAMGLGKPVIASDIGGVREVIVSGRNGILVEPENSASLAAAVKHMMSHPDEALRLGAEARSTVLERFTAGPMCARVEEIYEEALGG